MADESINDETNKAGTPSASAFGDATNNYQQSKNRNFTQKVFEEGVKAAKALINATYKSIKGSIQLIRLFPCIGYALLIGLALFLIIWAIIGVVSLIKGSSPLQQLDSSKPADVAQMTSLSRNIGIGSLRSDLFDKQKAKIYIKRLDEYISSHDIDKTSADANKKKLYDNAVLLKDKLKVLLAPETSTQDKQSMAAQLYDLTKSVASILGDAIR